MVSRRIVGWAAGCLLQLLPAQVAIEPRKRPLPPQKEITQRESTIRVDTNLVLVPVTVVDPANRPVVGLEKEHFRVFDDKVSQTIVSFGMEDDPVCIGFAFDTSGSMGAGLQGARRAAQQFFQNSESEDEYFLVEFDSRARLVVPLTRSSAEVQSKLLLSRSGGSTALLDAIYLALHEMKKSKKTKKALIVISDGGENNSRYTESELKNVLRETDTLIYSVGAGVESYWYGRGLMGQIAEQTGGLFMGAGNGDYADIARKIIIDLRNRYVLGYTPANQQRDGRYHRVQVQLVPPRGLPAIKAHWRMGYYAPLE